MRPGNFWSNLERDRSTRTHSRWLRRGCSNNKLDGLGIVALLVLVQIIYLLSNHSTTNLLLSWIAHDVLFTVNNNGMDVVGDNDTTTSVRTRNGSLVVDLLQHTSNGTSSSSAFLLNQTTMNISDVSFTTTSRITATLDDNNSNENTLIDSTTNHVKDYMSDYWTHAGARFPNGTSLGYVANVSHISIRYSQYYYNNHNNNNYYDYYNHSSSSSSLLLSSESSDEYDDYVCNLPPGEGPEQQAGWKVLTETITILTSNNNHNNNNITKRKDLQLLCAVYTHSQRHAQIQAIVETWGWRCDGFFAASNHTTMKEAESLTIVDLVHHGPETYNNMWQKTRSILAYMYDNYYDDFDFFFLCGDDTHVIVENLKALLHSFGEDAIQYPLYTGSWFSSPVMLPKHKPEFYIIHGGGGYVLNKITLRMLVVDLHDCFASRRSSSEDRWVAQCLNRRGVRGNSSVDDEGRQRFFPEYVHFVATFDGMNPHTTYRDSNIEDDPTITHVESALSMYGPSYRLWARHTGMFRAGYNLTSPSSISFHRLKTPWMMKRHHAILYKTWCPPETAIGNVFLSLPSS